MFVIPHGGAKVAKRAIQEKLAPPCGTTVLKL